MKELKDNMYAIIETGGKQYKVTEGDVPVSYTHLTLPTIGLV